MKLKTALRSAEVALTATLAVTVAITVPRLEALGDFAEAHNYPSEYIAHPEGEGWTKTYVRANDGKRMIFAQFEADQLAPSLQLRFEKPNKPLPIVFVGNQAGWVPARGDSIDWTLMAGMVDTMGVAAWDTVLAGFIKIGEECLCVLGEPR